MRDLKQKKKLMISCYALPVRNVFLCAEVQSFANLKSKNNTSK